MSQVSRARSLPASRHLDEMLSPYADRSLPPATLLTCDQHVSICPGCRAAADAERRLLTSLRSAATPGLSNRLESALLDLAGHGVAPAAGGPAQLAVMARSAPAVYRSPIRAAVMAGLVASASAAAAWSLGLSGVGVSAASSPVAGLPASASSSAVAAAAGAGSTSGEVSQAQAASFLSTNHFVPARGAWAGVPGRARHSAQSIHE